MSKLKGYKNPKSFFEESVKVKLGEHKDFLSSAGIRSKTISLEIEGDGGGSWSFNFDLHGHVSMSSRAIESQTSSGDCLIQMNEKTFEGILDGSVNVPMAFMFRKIKVKGDSGLAVKLGLALQKNFMS